MSKFRSLSHALFSGRWDASRRMMDPVPARAVVLLLVALLFSVAAFGRTGAGSTAETLSGPYPDAWKTLGAPESPAGKRLASFLEVLRTADAAATRDFVESVLDAGFHEEDGVEPLIEQTLQLAKELQGFEVIGMSAEMSGDVRARVRTPDDTQRMIGLGVDPAPPHLVNGLMIRPVDELMDDLPPIQTVAEADALLTELAEGGRFGGALLVVRGGEVVHERGYGPARRDPEVPVTPNTLFDVGSITKAFTRVAILQQVAAGKLSLDDTLGQHVEGFEPDIADRVQVRHLLEMTSGFGDYLMNAHFQEDKTRFDSVGELVVLIRGQELAFAPGEGRRYSNAGYVLLGAILESVTGRDYYELIEKDVFARAGMEDSRFLRGDDPAAAMGYMRGPDSDALVSNKTVIPYKGSPAGSSYSTPRDLYRFQVAMDNDQLGVGRDAVRDGCIAGGGPGVNAVSCIDREAGVSVILMANVDEGPAERIGVDLFRALRDQAQGD